MENYAILSEKRWNTALLEDVKKHISNISWFLIDNKADFSVEYLNRKKIKKIFIPHWSYVIPKEIYEYYECIVFHMTDLPYGRGGSPLQNLIVRGHQSTKISALRVTQGLDEGPIYLKKELSLFGTAEEIFIRANQIILHMIIEITNKDLRPIPQNGNIENFKRRKPEEGNIENLSDINKVYDYIRMLDAHGYPKSFLETSSLKFEFSRASLKSDGSIIADVTITKKQKND